MAKQTEAAKKLKVTLTKSTIAELKKHQRTVEALGLRKIRSSAVLPDNDATRGMVFVVKHMVTVEEIDGSEVVK
ncbi:MAG: 50S ribosomal protein L30 [Clostridiales bacterium]|jgi:large subunit ribosomal protein L30|nr:50S ribosomal protein L30 [Clostridiales bacterium]